MRSVHSHRLLPVEDDDDGAIQDDVDQRQMAVVSLQPVLRIPPGRAEPVHADSASQPTTDLDIRDGVIGGYLC
jgi:hypothetical protein